eukprot:jgi/Chlat1/2395/Chrsp17S02654
MAGLPHALSLLPPFLSFLLPIALHLLLAPYTKVEESFGMQASHDVMYYALDIDKYDHLEFPGVVPRTFIGPIVLSSLSAPLVFGLHLSKLQAQYVVRGALAFICAASLTAFYRAILKVFGREVGRFFAVLCGLVQFHLAFYASRTLPNTPALAASNFAMACLLSGRPRAAVSILTAAMVIFRCDLVLFLGPISLMLLLTRRMRLSTLNSTGLIAALLALTTSVAVDSYFWHKKGGGKEDDDAHVGFLGGVATRLVWAEGSVLWYNGALGKSVNWGVSPWHWYLTSALPRALLAAFPLTPVGVWIEPRVHALALPAAAFIALYSFLGHKELRFIFPALPVFNVAAAAALARIYNNRAKNPCWRLAWLACIAILVASFGATVIMTAAARENYPGGRALQLLHSMKGPACVGDCSVHVGNLAATTGVSRFLGLESHTWSYNKTEQLTDADLLASGFHFLLHENSEVPGYTLIAHADGYAGLQLTRAGFRFPFPSIRVRSMVFLHERSEPTSEAPHNERDRANANAGYNVP